MLRNSSHLCGSLILFPFSSSYYSSYHTLRLCMPRKSLTTLFLAVYVGQGIYHHPLYRLRFIHQDPASFALFFPPKTFLDRNLLHSIYMTCPPSGKQPQVLAASDMLYHL